MKAPKPLTIVIKL
ncbi:unnamed protein product, partial [Diplocarpon coronariae]